MPGVRLGLVNRVELWIWCLDYGYDGEEQEEYEEDEYDEYGGDEEYSGSGIGDDYDYNYDYDGDDRGSADFYEYEER